MPIDDWGKKQEFQNISVRIPAGTVMLDGILTVPKGVLRGIVVFAHGSGSSRLSPRNCYVAGTLNERTFATLLADLLTPQEEEIDHYTGELRFNIPMLAERLIAMAEWVEKDPRTTHLPMGYFGASTGGGAALMAAAKKHTNVAAVVSRGGRPDLAESALPKVVAPVLLIVGERDPEVIHLNQQALQRLNKQSELKIVPRATHLFEEAGTLERVAQLAGEWFEKHMSMP
jgi:dienelactone hydrolase